MAGTAAGTGTVTLNSDMGEGLGLHRFGNDEALMDLIDAANVACGFHAGDPDVMDATVGLAKDKGVAVGPHPGLPDVSGFGRRRMALTPDEVRSLIAYQTGALTGFLRLHGMELSHIKPHGALYGMLAGDADLMEAAAGVAREYGVPFFGLAGTQHQRVCERLGVEFVGELYVDLDYDDDGGLIIQRVPHTTDPQAAADRVSAAMSGGPVRSTGGVDLDIPFQSVCVHSDASNSPDVARAVREAISRAGA